ncbi:O-succinylhomoserine sulfhydrylase [Saliniramus sp.]|uniref:O-succinylhomoserine sulfhydrylase n=1 Tax=Saliniramus sp. TaxID=2986772 RepID=UPI002B6291F4|nr:O-succinylhomoserine sulfhydrylase [Saliniramus sp.]HMB08958.1 O-succinylhomoserine sulfhydrylase [Saliniramus sp.]
MPVDSPFDDERNEVAVGSGLSDHLHSETLAVHAGGMRTPFGETSEALFLTQGFVYPDMESAERRFAGEDPDGFIYSRFSNPTVSMFEQRMATLDGAEAARATGTGMAAVAAALLGYLKAGDHVITSRVLFGSCAVILGEILPKFGVESTFIDGTRPENWRAALRPNTRAFFIESPANPTTELIDIADTADIAHEAGAILIVDNALGTPLIQNPLQHGADVVTYSATKHIDGQGRCLGGLVLASEEFIETHLKNYLRHTGPALSPFNAWVLLKGLETLPLRIAKQARNARALADALKRLPGVTQVLYPGLPDNPQAAIFKKQMKSGGSVLAFELEGGKEAAFRFGKALELVRISNNFGDAKSLVTHPATTTHQRFSREEREAIGISEGMLRLSAGLEHQGDLINDVVSAVKSAQ